jgi:hypothetical protein
VNYARWERLLRRALLIEAAVFLAAVGVDVYWLIFG